MRIEITIDDDTERKYCTCSNFENAINILYGLKCQQIKSRPITSRCYKCAYENTCPNIDINNSCTAYKRDPPDGGFYG